MVWLLFFWLVLTTDLFFLTYSLILFLFRVFFNRVSGLMHKIDKIFSDY